MPLQASRTAIDFSRRISFGLVMGVAMLSVTVAAVVVWMAMRQNEVAAENTYRMVKTGAAARLERLALLNIDYSLWDGVYDAALAGDEDWIYEIQPGDAGRFSWNKNSDEIARTGLLEAATLDRILGLLDAEPIDSRKPVTTYARSGADVWMLSGGWVAPWNGVPEGATAEDLPRQVHGLLVGPNLLSLIGAAYLIDDLALADAAADGKAALALPGRDGSPVGYLVWTSPLPGRHALEELIAPITLVLMLAGSGVLLASRYIVDTARRLEQALIAARAADRSKSDFIAGLSHELRTPLNGVIGPAEVLLMGDTIKDDDREMVDLIHRSGLTQLGLIEELLTVSSIEAGKRALDAAPFDPADALREVGALARPAAQAKGLDLDVTTTAGAPVLVLGDRHAFMQVCTNLIGNAVMFTETGSVAATLSMTTRGSAATMRLRVADTGPGIEPAAHGAIFERFHQLGAGLARQAGGAGLGLAITLFSLVDGRRDPHRERAGRRRGLPRRSHAGNRQGRTLRHERRAADHRRKERRMTEMPPDILVVDDNRTNIIVLQAMLKLIGYHSRAAQDGARAICAADSQVPTLILMDLSMPGISGIDAALEIRKQHPGVRIPIIAVTAHDTNQHRTACAEAGFDGFLTKPLDVRSLRRTLEAQFTSP